MTTVYLGHVIPGEKIDTKKDNKRPDPKRLEALRNLPEEILKSLSQEEIHSFLHDEVWPDTLMEKLKDYIV